MIAVAGVAVAVGAALTAWWLVGEQAEAGTDLDYITRWPNLGSTGELVVGLLGSGLLALGALTAGWRSSRSG